MCRKALIAALPELTYLDDRPVFPNERETTEAWAQGGVEAEREARDNIRERERAQDRRNFEFMQALRAEGFRQVRRRQGCRMAGSAIAALHIQSHTSIKHVTEQVHCPVRTCTSIWQYLAVSVRCMRA